MVKDRQVDRPVMLPLISWNLYWTDAHGSLQLSSQQKSKSDGGSTADTRVVLVVFLNHHLAFHLFTKVINWSKSARIDFSTDTSFSKFWPIFRYLDRVTHTQKSNIWGKKIYFQYFYSPSILYRLIKCPFPEKLASQNCGLPKYRQWEDDQVPEQQKKKGKRKKESWRERSI